VPNFAACSWCNQRTWKLCTHFAAWMLTSSFPLTFSLFSLHICNKNTHPHRQPRKSDLLKPILVSRSKPRKFSRIRPTEHVWRQPLAISRFVSRNLILSEATYNLTLQDIHSFKHAAKGKIKDVYDENNRLSTQTLHANKNRSCSNVSGSGCNNGMLLGFSKIHTAKCFRVPNVLSLRHLIREDDLSVFRRGFCSIFRNVGKKSTLNCEATKTEIIQIGKSWIRRTREQTPTC